MIEKLAINGGKPVRTKPWIENLTTGKEEKEAVAKVMDSGRLSLFEGSYTPKAPFSFWGGPVVQELEKQWNKYYGSKYAISVNSATSGLYAAIGALDVGYGDEVIVSPYTMSASASCALVYGAIPIFADVDMETSCLDPASIEEKISPRTKAIVVVHQFGIPAEMDQIMKLAKEHNIKVVEDAAQSHGAKYRGKKVGTIGDIGVFSLNVNKTIQAGEGGVCLTNNEELRFRLAMIRNHGEVAVIGSDYKNISNLMGYNYRLTEIQAAIGIEQLKKLDHFNKKRLELVKYTNDLLSKHDCFILPEDKPHYESTYYVYPFRYKPSKLGIKREELVKMVNAEGVTIHQGYARPIYFQPCYQQKIVFKNGYPFSAPENKDIETNYYKGACPNVEKLYNEEMLLSGHVRLPHTKEDMNDIGKAFDKVIASVKNKKTITI